MWTQAAVVGKLYALAKKFSITSYIGNALTKDKSVTEMGIQNILEILAHDAVLDFE